MWSGHNPQMATHGRMQETPNRRLCCALLSVKELLKHNGCPLGRLRNCCLLGGQKEQQKEQQCQCCLICCLLGGQQEQHLRQPRNTHTQPRTRTQKKRRQPSVRTHSSTHNPIPQLHIRNVDITSKNMPYRAVKNIRRLNLS